MLRHVSHDRSLHAHSSPLRGRGYVIKHCHENSLWLFRCASISYDPRGVPACSHWLILLLASSLRRLG
jgi:hypothetical protein